MTTLPRSFDLEVHGAAVRPGAGASPDSASRFDALYTRWFVDTCRFIRAFGGAESDLEDLAQEVFLVARRKLDTFDGVNEGGWLYAIARNTVRDHRRRRWWKSFFPREKDDVLAHVPAAGQDPYTLLARAEDKRLAHAILAEMSEKRRVCFVLFEVEGYSGEEIAALEGVPVATVWTRLHHARKDFAKLARDADAKAEMESSR